MNNHASLRIAADLQDLDTATRFVEEQSAALGVGPPVVYDVLVAVSEMVTNIIVHGYRGQPGAIEIALWPADDALVIRLRDQASPFDPTLVPAPDPNVPLEQRPYGGMGILLTRHYIDTISHRITADGGNELTLIKKGIIAA
jgi:anti-sigma regulatory factor (Ser/Thr protein kinase)